MIRSKEWNFTLIFFSGLEISICTVRHIIFLQDKCAVFHVPKLDQKKTINHVMAWERKQRSDFPLSPSLSAARHHPFLHLFLFFHIISSVKPPPSPFLCLLPPSTLFSSLFWTALLSHIFLPVNARVIFSLLCRDFKQTERGIRGLDEVPSISIAFRLLLRPLCDGGKQGLCVTPQPNLNWEECKSPGLQISEAAQLSGAGRR